MRTFALSLVPFASLLLARPALAAEPPPSAPPAEAPVPAPPPAPTRDRPADCFVDQHAGVADDDVPGIEQVVCAEVRESLPVGPTYRVDVARLGSTLALRLSGGGKTSKPIVLSGVEEVPVAAPRLVESLAEQKRVEETATVTNVVGSEARPHKKRSGEVHVWLGVAGVAALGAASGAGASVGLSAGSERWSFAGDLRATGGDLKVVALSGGVRHHFGASDTAPFATMGMALEALEIERRGASDLEGGGLVLFGEIGVDVLRTSQFGGAVALRVDVPTFRDGSKAIPPILGAGLSMRF